MTFSNPKACVIIGLSILFSLQCPPQHSINAADAFRLRVLSYNIHHAEGMDRKLDLQRIAGVIRSAKPDIVALQEVDEKVARTGGVDQPAELARMTSMNVVFGGNIELQDGHYGNAVLSRFPITGHKNHALPNSDHGEQRGFLVAELKVAEECPSVTLLATHLDHRRPERDRIASAKVINAWVAENVTRSALLAGDLNADPNSKTLKEIGKKWRVANEGSLATIPVDLPTKQIDFVLFRPFDRWRVVKASVLDESVASDHRPLLVELEWSGVSIQNPQPEN